MVRARIEGEVYASLKHKRDTINQLLRWLNAGPQYLGPLVGWHWINRAFEVLS